MKCMIYFSSFLVFGMSWLGAPAWAQDGGGGLFVDPHVAVGYNVAQGTNFMAALDVGYGLSERLAAGVGAYFSAGEHPTHDREIGAGPFVAYFQPLTPFLTAHVREDVDYIDQRDPILVSDGGGSQSYAHVTETGMASVTSLGLHLSVARAFGVSAGYRAVMALSNTDLGKNRSGFFFGFSIGI